ncbi:LysR family transcriptional regulator [Mycolicibacterium monacense]|uniref:LysR family transcriptional regulator n=4 Tax=Mycobacteriaceae TaxID=1762 RepID=A0AAD1MVP6_MYCMB|nr:LysR family transcriptional regulator [Mycolicibacterium monacense DSM 44395]OBB70685.1 LysR family transcriptional regulator [Mycolicibacterium monacense]OBF52125.1 LysR family transcriptional regulator [Mycolicibacterium monacense]ORB19126.1 LysR family transcriptional regulator [Mycolicibacterium monacense DSM 44395]QHP87107.1 LysR family transcriptional regulator [Mycolicibacterium monacense DSM 44395]
MPPYGHNVFDVRRLVVLREVVRCGSLSAAAVSLNYTTSAVSQQITALERDVGAKLLERGPSGTRVTAAGTRLLEHTDVILGAVTAAEQDLARAASAVPDTLRVASFSSAAATILPRVITRLRHEYPTTGIELVTADPDDGVALLGADGADAAMVTEVPGEPPEFRGVYTVPVYDDEFFVVLPRDHRFAAAVEVPFEALAAERWVVSTATGTCPDTRVFHTACRRAGFDPQVTFRADDYGTVQGMVAAGMGVSLVPSLAAWAARGDVAVRRLTHRPVRRVAVATAAEPAAASALARLVSLMADTGARLRARGVFSVPASPSSVA